MNTLKHIIFVTVLPNISMMFILFITVDCVIILNDV